LEATAESGRLIRLGGPKCATGTGIEEVQMSNIEELERRITAALDRIGKHVDNLEAVSPASVNPEELAQLRAELEEEKLVSGQLEERNKKLREKYDAAREALEAQLEAQRVATAKLDMEMQRMRAANEQLRSSNAALREANEKGVGEPHLINKAMLAELEGLRASRAVDRAEAEAIAETIGFALNGQLPQLEENV
jgi:hypothetical protein